jgi:diaminopimelate epimerase
MKNSFYKYQGTGNDFVIIDHRNKNLDTILNRENIAKICDRRFSVGADGLILLENDPDSDFKMVYFNADGNESSMCGNGGRCITAFAEKLNLIKDKGRFSAIDGMHEVLITKKIEASGFSQIKLKMKDVDHVEKIGAHLFMNTGSPHLVAINENTEQINVDVEGRKIRNSERFIKEGTNVNFIRKDDVGIFVRTYERGVEAETLSCGTGATAAALAAAYLGMTDASGSCMVLTPGGMLTIHYQKGLREKVFTDVWLEGPAQLVFTGEIEF